MYKRVYTCDRCKKQFVYDGVIAKVKRIVFRSRSTGTKCSYDLCAECFYTFSDWVVSEGE